VNTEFRKALIPEEIRSLCAFDRKIFPSDHFTPSEWKDYETYWLLLDGKKIGCCGFEKLGDTLHITTTGIVPAYRRTGFGQVMKSWEIAYARRRGFKQIVASSRKSNAAMIALNRKFGFRVVGHEPGHYENPPEPAVIMRLTLCE
jgi:ribosomal protein S18 acetylase RimI-like enzyme